MAFSALIVIPHPLFAETEAGENVLRRRRVLWLKRFAPGAVFSHSRRRHVELHTGGLALRRYGRSRPPFLRENPQALTMSRSTLNAVSNAPARPNVRSRNDRYIHLQLFRRRTSAAVSSHTLHSPYSLTPLSQSRRSYRRQCTDHEGRA